MGSLESYCESGVLLFVLDHNSSLGGTLHRPFQSGGGIVYFVGNHFQRHGYIVEQRCDAVSGGCLYLPASISDLECVRQGAMVGAWGPGGIVRFQRWGHLFDRRSSAVCTVESVRSIAI